MDDGTRNAGGALLERAVGYALCAVRSVTPRMLDAPTPCAGWDLRALLWHTGDSLAALYEGIEDGYVGTAPPGPQPERALVREAALGPGPYEVPYGGPYDHDPSEGPYEVPYDRPCVDPHEGLHGEPNQGPYDDPAAAFRTRASRLLGAWAASDSPADRLVAVGDLPLPAAALAYTGALEVAVHGWDIAQATGLPRPVPAALATQLMRTARQLVPSPAMRHPLFAAPLTVPAEADPSDRLVAFLGRDPYGARRPERRNRDFGRDGGVSEADGDDRDSGGRNGVTGRPAPA